MKKLTHASLDLNFHPVVPWPRSLPVVTWNGLVVAGFDRASHEDAPLFEITQNRCEERALSLAESLHECHPDLGLVELGRLYVCLQRTNLFDESWSQLCALKKIRDSESHRRILERLIQTPLTFQSWANEKRVGFRDISILNSLPRLEEYAPIFLKIPDLQLSKSEGVRALELACELRLMGHSFKEIFCDQRWISHLERLRFPKTTKYDETMAATIQKLPWPRQLTSRWARHGDQGTIEVRFQIESMEAFEQTLHGLQKVSETLRKNSPWSN